MRVLRLRFKNLNSLAGEWEIDFTHPDYVSSGIFAITGPTGAGKTTILDAICLAFYGQTPRLSRISQSENETMSRQTGECFAEVEFETIKGRFRCHWSQHRSRKLASGQLQAPRHEIAEVESGRILESKLKAVAAKVEEVSGMDFDRFTRSMLLAQGGFAAFLQARPDERAPILEQITGTEIYSQISIKVHERTAEERKRLAEMRAEIDGIKFLSSEEEAALRAEILARQGEEIPLAARLNQLRAAQTWRERLAMLASELLQLDEAWLVFTAKQEAAAPDLERLVAAGRALALAGDYANLGALRAQQRAEEAELQGIGLRLPKLEQGGQTAQAALAAAEFTLAKVREEQSREIELIRTTRELDVKLGEAAAQLKAISVEIGRQKEQRGEYQAAIDKGTARWQACEAERQEAHAFLTAHQVDAGLVEALAGIEQQLKALLTVEQHGRGLQEKLGRQAAVAAEAQRQLQRETTAFEAAAQAVLEAEGQWLALGAVRDNLLQGRDLSAWRQEAEGLTVRQGRLQTLQEVLSRREEMQGRLAEVQARAEALAQKRLVLMGQEEALAAALTLREEVCRQRQDKVVLLNRVRDLEAERAQLVDGAPCPLCGASDHPYARGNVPPLDEAQRELEQAAGELKSAQRQLAAVQAAGIGVNKDLEQAGQAQAEFDERLGRDHAFCAKEFAELELAAPAESWPGLLQTEVERVQGGLATLRGVIRQAESCEQEERQAQAAVNRLKEALAQHDKARLAAELGHKSALREGERLEVEAATQGQTLDLALAEVGRALAPYGCAEVVPAKVEALLADLQARRNAYALCLQAQERLHKDLADIGSAKEKQQALLIEAEKALAEKALQLRTRAGQRDELASQRQALYGDRDPDVEEKRLAEALNKAGEGREKAMQGHNRLQAELLGENLQIRKLTAVVSGRGAQLAELEPAFARRLTEAGFGEEAAFLQASLPPAEFEGLKDQADRLRQEETELQTRRQDRRSALLAEQEKNLTDRSQEQIREESVAIAGQVSALQQELGARQQQLQFHGEQQQRHQARLQEIERQKQECARWERLHLLIGSSDGKKFRNFAQGLTFELMVHHANRQLQKMSDRYILVRDDSEPLELNVIDNYQAGEVRSTKNLSGGESFIASLALSLGLSSMASRTVRVDSLFLDEGFGTLDEDALETALETLAGLQQDGKLIGIISHVPALKERIGTQIQVEAGSAGRSSLQGPGCRRVL